MFFPNLKPVRRRIETQTVFKGINQTEYCGPEEWKDASGLSSDMYPALTNAKADALYGLSDVRGMICDGNYVYYVQKRAEQSTNKYILCRDYRNGQGIITIDICELDDEISDRRTLLFMGAYLLVFPDKVWVNTVEVSAGYTLEHGNIEAELTLPAGAGDIKFTPCNADGAEIEFIQPSQWDNPQNGQYWVDQSTTPHTLKRWSKASKEWVDVPTAYILISWTDSTNNVTEYFSEYDTVKLSGFAAAASSSPAIINQIGDINGDQILYGVSRSGTTNKIVIAGMLDAATDNNEPTAAPTISRKMPDFDYITEANNRLWACRYRPSSQTNEIYASKLGDFKNWYSFLGISTDSYAVTVGENESFTGAATLEGVPYFFRENCYHFITGSVPSNFRTNTVKAPAKGVKKGCAESLQVFTGAFIYLSPDGVCLLSAKYPKVISDKIGTSGMNNAAGGVRDRKYYLSAGATRYIYDARYGTWQKTVLAAADSEQAAAADSEQAAVAYRTFNDKLLALCADDAVRTVEGGEDRLDIVAETAPQGYASADHKYVSRIDIRCSLEAGTTFEIYIKYDESSYEKIYTITAEQSAEACNVRNVVIVPRRCDHYRLKFMSSASDNNSEQVIIHSITKTYSEGSAKA